MAGLLAIGLLWSGVSAARAQAVERPRITGISHVGYFVSDLPKALEFWHDLLGYDESYTLPKPGSTDTRIAFIKINDHQHVELFTDAPVTPKNQLSHVCFAVSDVEQMRRFLRSKGYDVKAGGGQDEDGGLCVRDQGPGWGVDRVCREPADGLGDAG